MLPRKNSTSLLVCPTHSLPNKKRHAYIAKSLMLGCLSPTMWCPQSPQHSPSIRRSEKSGSITFATGGLEHTTLGLWSQECLAWCHLSNHLKICWELTSCTVSTVKALLEGSSSGDLCGCMRKVDSAREEPCPVTVDIHRADAFPCMDVGNFEMSSVTLVLTRSQDILHVVNGIGSVCVKNYLQVG